MSQLGRYVFNSGLEIELITGDAGGPVGPDGLGNLNLLGAGGIIVTGNPGTNTLTISFGAGVPTTFHTDGADATPALNAITIAGGNNIITSGAGSTVTIDLNGTTNHAVQVGNATGSLTSVAVGATNTVLLGNTGADPSWGTVGNAALTNSTITLTAGTNITITGSPVALGGAATINANTNLASTVTNVFVTPYVAVAVDYYLSVDTSALAITIQLPNAPAANRMFVVKDRIGDASIRNITVTTVGGAVLIDGATTFILNTDYQSIQLIWTGASYEIF